MTVVDDGLQAAVDAAVDAAVAPAAEKLVLDFDSLTFGEMCDIEDAVGESAASTLLSGRPSPKAVTAAIWIMKRRAEPELSFDDVRAMTVASVEIA